MAGRQRKNDTEQTIKGCGCALVLVVVLAIGGWNALFGDDDKKPASALLKPAASPSQTVALDGAASSACSNSVAADTLLVAGKLTRAKLFDARGIEFARRSAVPELRAVKAGVGGLDFWCSLHLPDINEDTVDKHLPSFRKEHNKLRAEAKKIGTGGGSGSNGDGGINWPGKRH